MQASFLLLLAIVVSANALNIAYRNHITPSVRASRLQSSPQSSPSSDKNRFVSKLVSLSKLIGPVLAASATAVISKQPANAVAVPDEVVPTKGFQTRSGLRYFNIKETGTKFPLYGQLISFHYSTYYRPKDTGKLEILDSSHYNDGDAPFLQKHGNGRVIAGVDEALHTMAIGAKRRIIVPNTLGFTKFGLGPLPLEPFRRRRLGDVLDSLAKNTGELVFDLEMVSMAEDENDQGFYDDVPVTQDDVRKLAIRSIETNRPEFYEKLETTTPKELYKK